MLEIKMDAAQWKRIRSIIYKEVSLYPTHSMVLGQKNDPKNLKEFTRKNPDGSTVLEYRYADEILRVVDDKYQPVVKKLLDQK